MSSPDRIVRPPKRQRHQHSVGENGSLDTITSGYSLCPAGRTTHAVTAAPKTDALSRCGAGASPTNNAQPPIPRGGVGYDHWKGERQKVVAGRDADLNYRDRLVLLVNKRVGSMRQADRPHGPMCVAGWRVPACEERPGTAHSRRDQEFVAGWRVSQGKPRVPHGEKRAGAVTLQEGPSLCCHRILFEVIYLFVFAESVECNVIQSQSVWNVGAVVDWSDGIEFNVAEQMVLDRFVDATDSNPAEFLLRAPPSSSGWYVRPGIQPIHKIKSVRACLHSVECCMRCGTKPRYILDCGTLRTTSK